jgi:hypothetical protein
MASVTMLNRSESPAPPESELTSPSYGELRRHTLRRTGQRAFAFEGVEICSSTSHSPGPPAFWYEINLYRRANEQFVVDIRFFSKSDNMRDRFQVVKADGLEEVASILEAYEPAHDIEANVDPEDQDLPASVFALKAATLRMRIDEARRQFRDLVGEVLHQLDI